jgi:hypothetical protein
MIDDGKNEDEIAAELNVFDQVITSQIENADRIDVTCAA